MTLPAPRADLDLGAGYHSPQVDVEVRLNTNESPFAPPPEWREEVTALAQRIRWNRYPDRDATELREALAAGHGVRPDQVFCANGSNEVLQALCLAYGGPDRSVLTFEPTYALHSFIARIAGTRVAESGRDSNFAVDLSSAADAMRTVQPSITFLCSPNNPTGNTEAPATVRHVAEAAPGLVVVDEAYGQFADWSALELVGDDVPLVVVRTFSKTWSLAGLRLGYLVAPAEVVAACQAVSLPYHLDAFKQAAGLAALKYVEHMEAGVAAVVAERQRVLSKLSTLPVDVWPSQSNFVLFRPTRRKGPEVWQALVDRGVLVRNMVSWPTLTGCLRVTVGTAAENEVFLEKLSEVL